LKIVVITIGHHPDDDRIQKKEIQSLLDHDQHVLLLTWNQKCSQSPAEKYRHVDIERSRLSLFKKEALRIALHFRPDRIIIHEFELLPLGAELKKRLKIPLIYDIHDAHKEMWSAFSSRKGPIKFVVNNIFNAFEAFYLPHVDRGMTPNPTLIDRYQDRRVPMYFVPNYPRIIQINKNGSRNKTRLIYHGQISHERGIGDLIEVCSEITDKVPEVSLDIYGSERVPGTISSLKKRINSDAISFHSHIPHEEMLNVLMKAHIGVIPFRDFDLFRVAVPTKIFEYMLCECAVVATDLPPMRSLAGNAALYFEAENKEDLHSKILLLINDADKRKRLASWGRKRVDDEYNWGSVEDNFLQAVLN
jgi:glycosyltransferase involved in cell wall biosynthesis